MKLVGRIPVEPLDDERMTNIERSVVSGASDAASRAHAPRPRWYLGAATVMAVAAALVIGWKLGAARAPAQQVALATPVRVDTTKRTIVDIGDAKIESDPATVFAVTRPDRGVLVEMTRGKVELEVGKRGNRPPLVVRAGDTDVIVVGTHFSVDYGDGTGEVDVRVTEGVVVVKRHHEEQARVAAGNTWKTKRGLLSVADARAADAKAGIMIAGADGAAGGGASGGGANGGGANGGGANGGGANGGGASGAASGSDASGTVAQADDSTHPTGDYQTHSGEGPDVLRNRVAQVPDQRIPPMVRPSGNGNGSGGSGGGNGGSGGNGGGNGNPGGTSAKPNVVPGAGSGAGTGDLKTQIDRQPLAPAADIGEPDGLKAMSKYREAAGPSGAGNADDKASALYSLAALQFNLGRKGDALQTLDEFMRRFEHKREHASALWLRVRILCDRAIDQTCRQAAHTYMDVAPGTPASHVAELITIE